MGEPSVPGSFVGVDEETGHIDVERRITIAPVRWRRARLVQVTLSTSPLPQDMRHLYLRTPSAVAAGHAMIVAAGHRAGTWRAVVDAQEAYLRANRWEPTRDDDWSPPEDRGNLWDFERALEEQRRRDEKGGGHG